MTPTRIELATFWSGVRRATIAPRSHLKSVHQIIKLNTWQRKHSQFPKTLKQIYLVLRKMPHKIWKTIRISNSNLHHRTCPSGL